MDSFARLKASKENFKRHPIEMGYRTGLWWATNQAEWGQLLSLSTLARMVLQYDDQPSALYVEQYIADELGSRPPWTKDQLPSEEFVAGFLGAICDVVFYVRNSEMEVLHLQHPTL